MKAGRLWKCTLYFTDMYMISCNKESLVNKDVVWNDIKSQTDRIQECRDCSNCIYVAIHSVTLLQRF